MQNTIYVTDDYYRPSDYQGNPVAPTGIALDFGAYGDGTAFFSYTVKRDDERYAGYIVKAYIGILVNRLTEKVDLRASLEFSTDDFNTIVYSRTAEKPAEGYQWVMDTWGYTCRDTFHGYGSIKKNGGKILSFEEFVMPLYDCAYKVRFTNIQYRVHNSSTIGPWRNLTNTDRVYSSYAPFTLPIYKPAQFVLNGLNTFDAVIEAEYESRFKWTVYYGESGLGHLINGPVRNENYPYITSGERTEHIYMSCCISRGSRIVGEAYGNYSLEVYLDIVDPGDSNFKITVGCGSASGDCYYQENDDVSMLSVQTTFSDLNGYLDQYGYVLRDTGSIIRATTNAVPRYGVSYSIYYQSFEDYGTYNWTKHYEGKSPVVDIIDQQVPTGGSSISTRVQTSGCGINTETFTADVIDYFVPSFPSLAIHRCDEYGVANDSGDHCKIEWAVNISPIDNQNSKKLIIDHSDGTTIYDPLDSYSQAGVLVVHANTESSYRIVFTVVDDLNSETRTLVLSSAGVVMDWMNGGKGVSFGKVASSKFAVEIGEMWKLICYNLVFSGTNMSDWMKEVIARLNGIEQFASNLGSTSQYQVTFYNENKLISRQWIRSGQNASEPDGTPEKDATDTTTYSFAGWAPTRDATSADPNALNNITSYRNIYAVYVASTRYYSVFYYNMSNLIYTAINVQFRGNASYSGATPTSENGEFVGWRKSGLYIGGNTDAYAQFYDDTEITDSWEEIIKACDDGTYASKYKQGNYKILDLGSFGTVKMRIKGFKIHYGSGRKKIPISWEADTRLRSSAYRMSPLAEYVYGEQVVEGFKFDRFRDRIVEGLYDYYYVSTVNAPGSDRRATATFTVTAKRACSCSLSAKVIYPGGYSGTSVWHVDSTMNGEVKQTDARPNASGIGLGGKSLTAGETITYTIEAYKNLGSNNEISDTYLQLDFYSDPDAGQYVVGDGSLDINMSTNMVDGVVGIRTGTGTSGGFEASGLHNYLQNYVKPEFPEELRRGLKKARLATSSAKPSTEYPFVELVQNDEIETDLFIPSSEEILGSYENVSNGVDFNVIKYQYREKQNEYYTRSYWCRDVSYNSLYQLATNYSVVYGFTGADGGAFRSIEPAQESLPVYICFCT